MTENEFMRQIWRPYDTVQLEGGVRGRVTSVCFPTRSVKANISDGVQEWVRCEMIVSHKSAAGATDDATLIDELRGKLRDAYKRNEDLQGSLTDLKMKVNGDAKQEELRKIRKASNKIFDAMNSIDSRLRHIDEYLSSLEAEDEE